MEALSTPCYTLWQDEPVRYHGDPVVVAVVFVGQRLSFRPNTLSVELAVSYPPIVCRLADPHDLTFRRDEGYAVLKIIIVMSA